MEQHDSTPLKHHSETANPNSTATQTSHFHETLRLCSETHHLSCITYNFYANHNGIAAQTDTWHVHEKSRFRALPNGRAIGAGFEHLRTVANGCGHENNDRRTQLHPQTPKLNENPSLRFRETKPTLNPRTSTSKFTISHEPLSFCILKCWPFWFWPFKVCIFQQPRKVKALPEHTCVNIGLLWQKTPNPGNFNQKNTWMLQSNDCYNKNPGIFTKTW